MPLPPLHATASALGLQDQKRLTDQRLYVGAPRLMRDLVLVGLDLAAVPVAAALVEELDEIAREEQERGRDFVVDGVVHRTCRLCGATLPLTPEHFYTRTGYGTETRCQTCRREHNVSVKREREARKPRSRKLDRAA